MQCPKCNFENLPEARFCGQCGTRLIRDCQICGLANPIGYAYCHRCGTALDQATAPASPTSAQPTPALISTPPQMQQRAPATSTQDSNRLADERRIATIIMADVQGSTDLLETLGTEAWVEMMHRVFQILETEIYRFGGKVDQFRGDGLVAFFGATTAHEDDPERAVLAALEIQKALKPYAAELASQANVNLCLRVGVNTGEIIVTRVGDQRQYSEDTAMGEGITLAARMETAAEAHTVLVSENTYVLVQEQFEWLTLDEIHVKGIRQPVKVYRPLHPRNDSHATYDLSSPLIGRDAELEALRGCTAALYTGRGGIVTLTGAPGMGKSLLLREMRHYFARQQALLTETRERRTDASLAARSTGAPPGRMLRGRCRSYNQSKPYAMWRDLLRNWLDIHPDEAKTAIRERLRQCTQALWDTQMDEYYPYLADFLDLPLEPVYAEYLNQLDAEVRRQQRFLALRGWVAALAAEGPLIISFNDMHWSATTSLDLLKYCLPLCDQWPILWLLSFRPERQAPVWKFRYLLETDYPHRLTALTLPPLDKANSQRFIAHLIGSDVLPPATANLIIDKAQGNPYYIQELIRALIVQGVLVKQAGEAASSDAPAGQRQWYMPQTVTALELPDSIHTLLLARIDRLAPAEHDVLQMAAVIGSVFWCNVLPALLGAAGLERKQLTALLRAQLIRERGRDTDLGTEYIFTSPLIREAAYDSLLSTQRAESHLRVAEYFETRFDLAARAPYLGILAYHYQHAEQPEKELFYTLKQAEHAKAISANAEAGAHYTRALTLLDMLERNESDPAQCDALRIQHFDALYGRREMYSLMGHFNAMWEDARALLPLARQLTDAPGRLIDALLEQPGVADTYQPAAVSAAQPLVDEALALVNQIGDQHRKIKVLIARANQCLTFGDLTWQEHAENALALAQQIGDQRYEARLLIGLGKLYAKIDRPERSMAYLEEAAALALTLALDDIHIQTALLEFFGIDLERNGDYYHLLTEYVQEQLHLSREIGHRPLESKALVACGEVQGLYLGDYETGLSLLADSQHILEDTPQEAFPRLLSAQIYIALNMLPEAQAHIHAIEESGALYNTQSRIIQDLTTAMLYHALGDVPHLQTALKLLAQIRQTAADNPLVSQQIEMVGACKAVSSHLALAELTADATERELHHSTALQDSQAAYDLYNSYGYVQIIECVSEEILFRHSEALAANGYADDAIQYLRQAYDEMIYKYALIPADSPFRRTFLDNIPLHQDIRVAYAERVGSILTMESNVLASK